jgi:hypothetical protein
MLLLSALVVLLSLGAGLFWWFSHPRLVVRLDPELFRRLDKEAYVSALREAGALRIQLLESDSRIGLGRIGRTVIIAVVLSQDRNPELDEEMIARGLTGPGYTDGYVGYVYEPDVKLFIKKHRAAFQEAGHLDWNEIERRMITNTAVHESWHAIAQSTSHNPKDKNSVMYMDPGKAPLSYGARKLSFTAGHKVRLQRIFQPDYQGLTW